MAKVNKFGVLNVPLQVEYLSPVVGRLFSAIAWLILVRIRIKKFNITINNKTVCSFYRLIIPRFVKGGGADAE